MIFRGGAIHGSLAKKVVKTLYQRAVDMYIENLKGEGVSDEEILEVNQVSACFNYSNRVINRLGVMLGNERIGYY